MTSSPDPIPPVTGEHTIEANQTPAMTVEKTSIQPNFTAANQVIEYQVVVTNTGNITLHSIKIEDNLVDLTGQVPTESISQNEQLDVGESWTYTYHYTTTQADVDAGQVVNKFTVTSTGLTDPENPTVSLPVTDEHTLPAVQLPGMSLTKSAQEDSFDTLGQVIHYTVEIANTGNITLSEIKLTDSLVDVSAITPSGDENNNQLLDVGETWNCAYEYKITQVDLDRGFVRNAAAATSPDVINPTTPPQDEHVLEGVKKPGLLVEKSSQNTSYYDHGQALTYQVKLTNTGNVTLTGIEIEDSLVDVSKLTPTESLVNNQLLEVGETWTYTYTYYVTDEDLLKDTIVNQVHVTTSELTTPQSSELSIGKAFIDVVKIAEPAVFTHADQAIQYRVIVTNTGQVDLTNLVITDSLVDASDMTRIMPEGETDEILSPDEVWYYDYVYTTTPEDVARGVIANTATVKPDQLPNGGSYLLNLPLAAFTVN